MGDKWKVFVRLHNLVNIPFDVCTNVGPSDTRVFSVIARAVSESGVLLADCCEIHAEFTTRDIVHSTPEGFLEVKLDAHGSYCAAAAEWTIHTQMFAVFLAVKERGASFVRLIGSCNRNLIIDVANVVKQRKLETHIVGTEMGQIGISFAVAPSDKTGYKQRLEDFLLQHNPAGVKLVDSVVSGFPEVDTFTKLYRKYGVVDYKQRIEEFFCVYGQGHLARVPALLQEWDGREEELIHNLVLDNGPEPESIVTATRLNAFLRAYNLSCDTPEVARVVREFGNTPHSLFKALTTQYGPEPDPRSYLFIPTCYEMMPQESQGCLLPTAAESPPASMSGQASHKETLSSSLQEKKEGLSRRQTSVSAVGSSVDQSLVNAPTNTSSAVDGKTHHDSSADFNKGEGTREQFWDEFCESLLRRGREPSDVYYMSETLFHAMLGTMDYTRQERDVLLQQWQQRLRAAVHEEKLTFSDSYYDTAVKEVHHVVGLPPLNLEVVSVTTVSNREHASCFASRLLAARERATDRLAIVGDYQRLRDIVTHGTGNGDGDGVTSHGNPCAIFYRSPFQNWDRRQATCILICDVVIGRPFVCPPLEKRAREATEEFRKKWDCCVFHDSCGGKAVAVYDPQQVLPRFIVQCYVDTTVTPCPAHLSRAVEYYVLDENTFACSRCVVLGAYRGKEVLAIEDAAVHARSRLFDYERDAQQLAADFGVHEAELGRKADEIKTAPLRIAAEKEIERIRRQAEESVAAILRDLEQKESEELSVLKRHQERVRKARKAANVLAKSIAEALQHSNSLQVVLALQNVRVEDELQNLKAELQKSNAGFEGDDVINTTSTLSVHVPAMTTMMGGPVDKCDDNGVFCGDDLSCNHIHDGGGDFQVSSHAIDSQETSANTTSSSLYAKYLAVASSLGRGEGKRRVCAKPAICTNQMAIDIDKNNNCGDAPSDLSSNLVRHMKETVTKGWALCRQGDLEGARQVWRDVYERCADNAVGARARAYIAEAIERDYNTAAAWYDISLQRDPFDAMTLYNYGVLLETFLGRSEKALMLFERAHSLGDGAAGRRAQQLRFSLGSS